MDEGSWGKPLGERGQRQEATRHEAGGKSQRAEQAVAGGVGGERWCWEAGRFGAFGSWRRSGRLGRAGGWTVGEVGGGRCGSELGGLRSFAVAERLGQDDEEGAPPETKEEGPSGATAPLVTFRRTLRCLPAGVAAAGRPAIAKAGDAEDDVEAGVAGWRLRRPGLRHRCSAG